jgi:hypothetical protein
MKVGNGSRRGNEDQTSAGTQSIQWQPQTRETERWTRDVNRLLDFLDDCERMRRPMQGQMRPNLVRIVPERDLQELVRAVRGLSSDDGDELPIDSQDNQP